MSATSNEAENPFLGDNTCQRFIFVDGRSAYAVQEHFTMVRGITPYIDVFSIFKASS